MKISLNTLRYYQDLYKWSSDPAPNGVETLVEQIGAQLGAVEETIKIGEKYQGIVIVRVVSCRKHENSDHLNICLIDDGGVTPTIGRDEYGIVSRNEQGFIQVVCGAPNVREGLTVAWLPPGSTVPASFADDPFVLSVREIRGETSHGMLASPKELALGDSHEGILEIDTEIAPGTSFADYYGLSDDVVIDIENKMFTHRPDCFGWIGVAREIAGIQGQPFTSPSWYTADDAQTRAAIESLASDMTTPRMTVQVRNEIPELVPRFAVLPMDGIVIAPSPVWLQVTLVKHGLRPINNVVDFTNYYMLLTGQPLHAYDYDKVMAQDGRDDGAVLVVRTPQTDEQLQLLSGKTISPRPEAIIIATETKAIGLGGVMGGADTEVDDNTRRIILESASFDMYSIRRTSMAHGLFSDAVTRFNKGQSPLQNLAVLAQIAADITNYVGGKVAGALVDDNQLPTEITDRQSINRPIVVSADYINQRLGLSLFVEDICQLLANVEFQVHCEAMQPGIDADRSTFDAATKEGDGPKSATDSNTDQLHVKAPFWRTYIEIAEDIVEEVGRLYGFDHLPLVLPVRSISPAQSNAALARRKALSSRLSHAGATEVLSYSFVHGKLLERVGQSPDQAFKLSNALSPDLQYFRLSLIPSLLDKVHANIKAGYDQFGLYEIGKAHNKGAIDPEGLPAEINRLAFVFAANNKAASGYAGAPYYQAKTYLETVLSNELSYTYMPLDAVKEADDVTVQMIAPFEAQRSAAIVYGEKIIGVVGEFKAAVRKAFKLPQFAAGFEIDVERLPVVDTSDYVPMSRYPSTSQDICLKVPVDSTYQGVYDFVHSVIEQNQPQDSYFSLKPIDIFRPAGQATHKQITLRLEMTSYDKTMTDKEVSELLDTVAQSAGSIEAERV